MLTKEELLEANRLIDLIDDIEEILRGFKSRYVETTVGLVSVNSASKTKTKQSDFADAFHNQHKDIEKDLKEVCAGLLENKKANLKAKLGKYIKKEQD